MDKKIYNKDITNKIEHCNLDYFCVNLIKLHFNIQGIFAVFIIRECDILIS